MKTQTIEVEGLPEGWKAKEVRIDPDQYNKYVGDDGFLYWEAKIKMEKIQPRRIVLEEISKEEYHRLFNDERCPDIYNMRCSYWREVKKTDIPLTNEEPKLSLTKKDMLDLIEHLKLGGQLNPKIAEFVDYEQPEPKLSLSVEQCKKFFNGTITGRLEVFQLIENFIKDK